MQKSLVYFSHGLGRFFGVFAVMCHCCRAFRVKGSSCASVPLLTADGPSRRCTSVVLRWRWNIKELCIHEASRRRRVYFFRRCGQTCFFGRCGQALFQFDLRLHLQGLVKSNFWASSCAASSYETIGKVPFPRFLSCIKLLGKSHFGGLFCNKFLGKLHL